MSQTSKVLRESSRVKWLKACGVFLSLKTPPQLSLYFVYVPFSIGSTRHNGIPGLSTSSNNQQSKMATRFGGSLVLNCFAKYCAVTWTVTSSSYIFREIAPSFNLRGQKLVSLERERERLYLCRLSGQKNLKTTSCVSPFLSHCTPLWTSRKVPR